MPLMQWSPELSVGVAELDEQHKQLLAMLNDLHAALLERRGREVVADIVERLKNYIRRHFTREEALLERLGYPDLSAHRAEHNQFIERTLDFDMACNDGGVVSPMEIQGFLRRWLVDHIRGTDKRYAAFLKAKGLR